MKPKRIQLKRTKGWRKPEGCVVVSRPTKWGNPFRVGPAGPGRAVKLFKLMMQHKWTRLERELAATQKEPDELELCLTMMKLQMYAHRIEESISELRGKDLACWCPDGPCHADILLEIANS